MTLGRRPLGALALILGVTSAVVVYGCGGTVATPVVPSPPVSSIQCGVERWPVKTLSDPNASRVDYFNISTTTISALNALTAHCSGLPESRTYSEEFRVFEVEEFYDFAHGQTGRSASCIELHPVLNITPIQ